MHSKEVWEVYQTRQQGHFTQSHCKSKKQTDIGKSMRVGGAVSYSQEQLWAMQWESCRGPFVFLEAKREKGPPEILLWHA